MSANRRASTIDGPPQNRPPVITVGGLLRRDRIRGMVGVACATLLGTLLVGCSSSGLSGKYLTDPSGTYGWEFDGDTVYSLLGDQQARGTYTVKGETVRVCIGSMCTEMRIEGDCIVHPTQGGRYCKD